MDELHRDKTVITVSIDQTLFMDQTLSSIKS